MPSRKKTPAAELVEKLLAVLEAQRALGKEAYPLTLQRLAELADPLAAPEVIDKAIGAKPFKDSTLVASKKDPAGLVALTADMEQLASDPRLLEWALAPLCTPEKPLWPLAKVKGRIAKKLQKPFEEAITRLVRENSLPPGVGSRLEKNKQHLYLQRFPPPPPPPRKPEESLGENLLQVLEAQRCLGGNSYPLSLRRLVELVDPLTQPELVGKSVGKKPFKDRAVVADKRNQETPVFMIEDQAQLLSSGVLLKFLMHAKRTDTNNAVAFEELLPKASVLHQPLLEMVNQRMDTDSLPPTIGWMWIGKKKQLFFLEDVHHGRQTDARAAAPTPPPAAPSPLREAPPDFALAFDEAFHQFNRRNGGHNFVSLVDMRKALPLPADGFDAELRKLRVAGRYTLSAAEGRHGVSPEEQKAGIVEDGSLLLYVSRKAP